jgi:WD40 repeat protein
MVKMLWRYARLWGASWFVLLCVLAGFLAWLFLFNDEISTYWSRLFPTHPNIQRAAVQPTPLPITVFPLSAGNASRIGSVAALGVGKVHDVAFAPNGKFFVAATSAGIGFYDADTLEQRNFLFTPGQVTRVLFSSDGELIISAEPVKIWDAATGKLLGSLSEAGGSGMALSADGSLLAVSADNEIHLWHLASMTLVRRITGQTGGAMGLAFSPDGRLLVAGSYGLYGDDAVYLWFTENGTLAQTLTGHSDSVLRVKFSPDGQFFATASLDTSVHIWQLGPCQAVGDACASLVRTLKQPIGSPIYSMDFSPDGRWVAVGEDSGDVHLWDVASGWMKANFKGDRSRVTGVAFSPDGERLVIGTRAHWLHGGLTKLTMWQLADRQLVGVVDMPGGNIANVAFSPDGAWVASTGAWDCSLRFWRVTDGSMVRRIDPQKCTYGMSSGSFSPDGQFFVSLSSGELFLWRVADGALLDSLNLDQVIWQAAFTPSANGNILALGLSEKMQIWQVQDEKLQYQYDLTGVIRHWGGLSFSSDGSLLAAISRDASLDSPSNYSLHIWRVADGAELQVISYTYHSDNCRALVFSPDFSRLAVVVGPEIWVWDWRAGELLYQQPGSGAVAFSPDGTLLASAFSDNRVQLLKASDGSQLRVLTGHTETINSIAFSPDGLRLVSAGYDGVVRIWGIARPLLPTSDATTISALPPTWTPQPTRTPAFTPTYPPTATETAAPTPTRQIEVRVLNGHTQGVNDIAYSPDGKWLASAGKDNLVKLWDTATGALMGDITAHTDNVAAVAFNPDGTWLASSGASDDATIRLWLPASGELLRVLTGHTQTVYTIAFSPDGKLLASGGKDGLVIVWRVADGASIHRLSGHRLAVQGVAFSPDGAYLASVSADATLQFWDVVTGESLARFETGGEGLNTVAYHPQGDFIAMAGLDGVIYFWKPATQTQSAIWPANANGVNSLAFSDDGAYLASGGSDNHIMIYDLRSGDVIRSLIGHTGWVLGVDFSPDGNFLATCGGDGDNTIRIWKIK